MIIEKNKQPTEPDKRASDIQIDVPFRNTILIKNSTSNCCQLCGGIPLNGQKAIVLSETIAFSYDDD